MDSKTRLLSAEDLAERFDVTVRTVWNMNRRGDLPPSLKVGNRTRWRLSDVDAWITARMGGDSK